MNRESVEQTNRRELVEYQEHLKDRSEEFDEARARLLEAGEKDAARRLSEEFGRWRSEYKRVGEEKGYRQPGVAVSTNTWFHWALIAFEAERVAKTAGGEYRATRGESDPTDALGRAYRASSTATVAAAFVVEGLYGSVCYLVPAVGGQRRWAVITRTLRLLFDLSRIRRLEQEMELLFGLRDDAAHPWIAVLPPTPHPYGFAKTSREIATHTPEVATQCIDVACTVLDECTTRPLHENRRANRWARDSRAGVERLLALRQ